MGKQRVIIVILMLWINYILLFPNEHSRGEVYSSRFEFEYDLTVDRTEDGTETDQTLSEIFELNYSQRLLPRLDVDFSFNIELENEFQSDGEDTTRLLPEVEIAGTADYWEMTLGAKRTRESNDQPFDPTSIQDSYFVEYFLNPGEHVPDLKLKYTVDTDEKGSETDTEDTSFEVSSVYELADFLKLKVDYTKDESEDRLNPDSDTIEETFSTEETLKYILSEKIKLDFKHEYEKEDGGTLLDAGGRTNEDNTKENTYDGKITYKMFEDTEIEGSYKFEREKDKIENSVTKDTDYEIRFDQAIGEPIEFEFKYSREIDEEKGTGIDERETEVTFTYNLDLVFSDLLDFSIKYEKTDTDEEDRLVTANSTTERTEDVSISWSADTGTFMDLSVSYDWSEEKERGVIRSKDRDISIKSTMEFEAIHLTLTPDYALSITEDFTQPSDQETRTIDFSLDIDYETDITDKLNVSFSHTYGRSVDQPGKEIQRDDDTNLDFQLDEPWEGSNFTLSLARNATDRNQDDSPPDITSNITFNWDHNIDPFDFSINYKYDKKKLTDDSETFDISLGWRGLSFDTSLKYSFNKTFSDELDESHSVTFNFNIEF